MHSDEGLVTVAIPGRGPAAFTDLNQSFFVSARI